ncbi:putative vesicle-associated membrane-protein-associated protein [Helianthus annuus]|nr:putative vesicle-associated membrane-protein-associated protein [Helianthus annuus]KAJ0739823.1 putative vesicle-associated membrane-protein-associated protein [Helianthus annuus]
MRIYVIYFFVLFDHFVWAICCMLISVKFTMQAQKEAPPDMQCKDKFLLQSAVAPAGTSAKDITPELFNKESGNKVEECKLKVNYVPPKQPPSPVREGSEEGSSPRGSISDNGAVNLIDSNTAPRSFAESQDISSEAMTLISKLTEEKNSAIQQSKRLHQELELLRRQGNKSSGGIPLIYVLLIGLVGLLLGYMFK